MARRCLLLAGAVLLAAHAAIAGDLSLFSGSVSIGTTAPRNFKTYAFTVAADTMVDARVHGHVRAFGGSGDDVEVFVMTETDFINWRNDHAAQPIYQSGRVTAADVNVPVGPGAWRIVFSNTFSTFAGKNVEGTLTLHWADPPITTRVSSFIPSRNQFVGIVVLVLVGTAIAAWSKRDRTKSILD